MANPMFIPENIKITRATNPSTQITVGLIKGSPFLLQYFILHSEQKALKLLPGIRSSTLPHTEKQRDRRSV
jgi:hypothetical protein